MTQKRSENPWARFGAYSLIFTLNLPIEQTQEALASLLEQGIPDAVLQEMKQIAAQELFQGLLDTCVLNAFLDRYTAQKGSR